MSTSHGPRRRHTLRALFGLWTLVGGLLLLARWLPLLPDAAVLACCGLLAVPLAWLLFRRRRLRRAAFRAVALTPGTPWQHRLRGGLPMLLGQSLVALGVAGLLVLGVVRLDLREFWLLLIALVPVWLLVHGAVLGGLTAVVNRRFLRVVSDRVAGWLVGLPLLAALLAVAFHRPVPSVSGLSIEGALAAYTAEVTANSVALEIGLVLAAAAEALPQWFAQNLAASLPGSGWQGLAWTLVLLREWLVVWPLMLLVQAVHGWLDRADGHARSGRSE